MSAFPTGTGDLVLTDDRRSFEMVTGLALLRQRIHTSAQIFRGQFRYDLDTGLPYFEQILIHGPNENVIAEIFRRWLLSFAGVERVKTITVTLERETRALSVAFVVETTFDLKPLSDVLKYTGV